MSSAPSREPDTVVTQSEGGATVVVTVFADPYNSPSEPVLTSDADLVGLVADLFGGVPADLYDVHVVRPLAGTFALDAGRPYPERADVLIQTAYNGLNLDYST